MNYLVKNGSERVVTSSREHIYDLRSLENYSCFDENGKDQGINIRHKVKITFIFKVNYYYRLGFENHVYLSFFFAQVRELIDFIKDDEKLREERKKAKKNKDKYIGMSSEAMSSRFGGDFGGYRDTSSNWEFNKNESKY